MNADRNEEILSHSGVNLRPSVFIGVPFSLHAADSQASLAPLPTS